MVVVGHREPVVAVDRDSKVVGTGGAMLEPLLGRAPRWIATVLALAAVLAAAPCPSWAQDLEPRAYSNTPIGMNFLIAGYLYSSGSVSADASIPLEDAKIETNYAVLAYARSVAVFGQSGKVDVILPYGWADGSALFQGQPRERVVDGLVDPRIRVSVNLYGAPALSLEDWLSYRQDVIVGASLQVSVPIGQYDSDKLVNLGSNRWFFKPELGVSKAWGPVILELSGAATIYTDNRDFFDHTREQDPTLSVQGHFLYTIWRNMWAAFDVTYYAGGRTSIDGEENDDRQSNTRVGFTLVAPVSKHHSVKLYGSTTATTRTGTDFDTVGVAWQYRWGAGL